ncbi:MAG: site-specific recombinase [Neisseriaceae bacterium]|nr:site-specific recombinase [Neisseriaceae bacterium]
MEAILQSMLNAKNDPLPSLKALIDALRPARANDSVTTINNAHALCYLLEHHAEYRAALGQQLLELLGNTRQVQLYTDTGILSNESFFTTIKRRIGYKILPPPVRNDHLKDLLGQLFPKSDDYVWLNIIPVEIWLNLSAATHLNEIPNTAFPTHIRVQQLEAIQILACRLSAIGLEPEIVLNHPDVECFESPFVRLNAEILDYIERHRDALIMRRVPTEDHAPILVLLDQCETVTAQVWKFAAQNGSSVSLTYHLLRIKQHIDRLKVLFELIDTRPGAQYSLTLLAFVRQLVEAENNKYSIRDVLSDTTELLALQVTEHASQTGEHYISETRHEWLAMFRSAAGAGAVVGFMALFKILIAHADLPPLLEAFAFSMNYALGFMLIHVLHFTVATKQPAMTAARIAAVFPATDLGNNKTATETELLALVVKVIRTQFIAIVGNVLLAVPVALGISMLFQLSGYAVINTVKADKLMHDLQPFCGNALLYAAITGVCLFLAGLISGYYDNKALYNQIPQRIAALPLLNRLLGEHHTMRLSLYIQHNLGALAGNFYFGLMLGSLGTIGFLLGLPLDIRHITFAAANLAYVVSAYDFSLTWSVVAWNALCVILIGLCNLYVSFALALWVAMRSRKRRLRELKPLIGKLLRYAFRHPRHLFIPPKTT